jgi:hypothetical protein
MSTFLTITYTHLSIGRVELWMEGTGTYDEDGYEIKRAIREPTEEDLAYAARTEEGKIRTIRAIVQLCVEGSAIQTALHSEQYDTDMQGSALPVMVNLKREVDRIVDEKVSELLQDHALRELPPRSGFEYRPVMPSVTWTAIHEPQPKKEDAS